MGLRRPSPCSTEGTGRRGEANTLSLFGHGKPHGVLYGVGFTLGKVFGEGLEFFFRGGGEMGFMMGRDIGWKSFPPSVLWTVD